MSPFELYLNTQQHIALSFSSSLMNRNNMFLKTLEHISYFKAYYKSKI